MKRTIIGGFLLLSGTLISLSILIAAAFYASSLTAWRGSKLGFAIFGANDLGNSLSLGFPFIVGLVLSVLGLLVLIVEFFNKN